MDKSWKLTNNWTMRKVKNLSLDDISRMKLPERADLAQYLYKQFQRRVNEAARAMVMPYGIKKMYMDFEKKYSDIIDVNGRQMSIGEYLGIDLDKPITKMRRGDISLAEPYASMKYANQTLFAYINQMKEFFSWKSGTVEGWTNIKDMQDARLFGHTDKILRYTMIKNAEDKLEKVPIYEPLRTMTEFQRVQFWSAIDEIRKWSTNALDYEHSEPLLTADFITLFDEDRNVDWNDLTSLSRAIENIINGNERTFPEYAPDSSGNDGGATPFGEVAGLERRYGNRVWE